MKKLVLFAVIFGAVSHVQAWELRQVLVKHVQFGNGAVMYISVQGDTSSASGCQSHNGWVRMDLTDPNVAEIKKDLTSLAITAFASKTPIDVGSSVDGCVNNYANLTYIRLGNYQ